MTRRTARLLASLTREEALRDLELSINAACKPTAATMVWLWKAVTGEDWPECDRCETCPYRKEESR
ncbi:MAG: hypothetical protein IJS32_05475 [Kiritimatiellae bacterium]|nr:hypothetical protein [Kiritimatiellia bacterium]